MKNVTIELSDEQYAQVREIMSTREGRSEKEIIAQIVERGIYALLYRTKYNARRYEQDAAVRAEFKAFKASRKEGALVGGSEIVAVAKK